MDLTIRPMTPQERMYSYSQSTQIESQTGCIGHLRGDLDSSGDAFISTWTDHRSDLKSKEFKDEFSCPGQLRAADATKPETTTRNYKKYGETAWVIAVLFLAFKLSAAGDYFRPHFLSLASRSFSHSAQKA